MKVVLLITFLLVTAHCTSIQEFHSGIRRHHFLYWKQLQRLIKQWNNCRKPPVNRRTTVIPTTPLSPKTDYAPPLTPHPPAPLTPEGRGDA